MDRDGMASQPLLGSDDDEPRSAAPGRHAALQQQRLMAGRQQQQLDRIGSSVGTLRNISRQIGDEVDQQNVLVEDITHDVDSAQGKMDATMHKMAKVLRITNDRRQWTAIAVLSLILFIIILLFFIL
ncbi:syntaxin-6-like [Amphibalanus amphitrite]|uniref:syntaxin-6-like n=1 Tax=Amphibalanus amphitrite TaxID=1232801 RepID=UPI001C92AFD5|nr:syntaxin-6-like [Amphibalanus amphitrite]XP_043209124.1 syntaxin-6-like [Amphibalanus amphitrite]XP_043209125.1 syntaxin-6-like [Amphibalanus amphitrite]XP_043209126.1 syntaxin-6-like [Amphibalanus amphitrite]